MCIKPERSVKILRGSYDAHFKRSSIVGRVRRIKTQLNDEKTNFFRANKRGIDDNIVEH